MTTTEQAFTAIADRLLGEPDVSTGTGFGSKPGLRVNGKIFAMLIDGALVLKLPADRCAELASAGGARPFDRGQGKPLKQWITVGGDPRAWPALTDEALAFVRAGGR